MHQGILYIGSGDSLVYALDAVSGMERWRTQRGELGALFPGIAG